MRRDMRIFQQALRNVIITEWNSVVCTAVDHRRGQCHFQIMLTWKCSGNELPFFPLTKVSGSGVTFWKASTRGISTLVPWERFQASFSFFIGHFCWRVNRSSHRVGKKYCERDTYGVEHSNYLENDQFFDDEIIPVLKLYCNILNVPNMKLIAVHM